MNEYSLEPGDHVLCLTCECCGEKKNRVWGLVSRDGNAHAVYYALLNVEEQAPRAGLTLSVGPWWEGSEASQRVWVHLNVWPETNNLHMGIRDPEESNFYPWVKGGEPLGRERAQSHPAIQEIWSVADFIVQHDPAVRSYLSSEPVDSAGRELQQADSSARSC